MSPIKAKSAHPATQIATPTTPLTDELLDRVLAALPPLVADALPAWHRTHRKWVSQEIAAFHPTDGLQTWLAGQIVVVRHIAGSMLAVAGRGGTSPRQAHRLGRNMAALQRAGELLLRTLRRRQKTPAPSGGARAAKSLGLPGQDARLRSEVIQRGTAHPGIGTARRGGVGARVRAMTTVAQKPVARGASS